MYYLISGQRPGADVREDPAARPPAGAAAARDPAAAALVKEMWAGDPEARPAAAECVRRLESIPAPGTSCCTIS